MAALQPSRYLVYLPDGSTVEVNGRSNFATADWAIAGLRLLKEGWSVELIVDPKDVQRIEALFAATAERLSDEG